MTMFDNGEANGLRPLGDHDRSLQGPQVLTSSGGVTIFGPWRKCSTCSPATQHFHQRGVYPSRGGSPLDGSVGDLSVSH